MKKPAATSRHWKVRPVARGGADNNSSRSDLARKLGWTILLLFFYRVGIHVPIPGIDTVALVSLMNELKQTTLLGMVDMFSGGGLSNMSIFALGVMPYISASIIMQLLQVVIPDLKRMAKEEGQAGRKKLTQYTRYGTVLITIVQGLALSKVVMGMTTGTGQHLVMHRDLMFMLVTTVTLTAGTILIMWIGERITEKGIGNGISLIIFAGIVAGIPRGLFSFFAMIGGQLNVVVAIGLVVLMAAVLIFIVFVERGQRRIPIHYAKRQVGRKMMGGQNTHLPLRLNTAGVIPPIFASSLLMFPATIAQVSTAEWLQNVSQLFAPTTLLYNVIFVALVIFFCFFYTAIVFDAKDISENLKKQGGFIPGIRPGQKTFEYIDKVLSRITIWGALYISAVCILPQILMVQFGVPFYFGGTSLLIVVGVAMDFMSRLESHMISRQYEGLLGKTRIKGRA